MSYSPQPAILDFGTSQHTYLEFDLISEDKTAAIDHLLTLVATSVSTKTGAVIAVGVRPELWAEIGEEAIPGLEGFNDDLLGEKGFVMPATQHDIALWIHGAQRDSVFDLSRKMIRELAAVFTLAESTDGWVYQHNRDLTGFVDGTENPSPLEAPAIIAAATGGSVLLLQRWKHEADKWESLDVERQEAVIGRTKDTDKELENLPENSHVARTDQEDFGDMLRRNTAYGDAANHGTMFVGVAAERSIMHTMLESMAGITHGIRDALTFFSHPETGSYYYLPPAERLQQALEAADTEDDE
ncbi:Dyp-type peroxidase [Actinomyces vulturis]|uniref:Dyp-type peroxidase n=1 Tax=Actinomyces vulturis TaxID=1857645 RepID=UPI00082ED63D|nr:Dyp-type peroxidase [Actinomyces vulturis]